MNNTETVFVAGHRGMVGSAIVKQLLKSGYTHDQIITRTRHHLNLVDQKSVDAFFKKERPSTVYLAAARVGGIMANNDYPAEFIYENLMIQSNVINTAFQYGVKKLLFLGSSCIYPKYADQPIHESSLLSGALEPTNEPYAIAKIAGLKLCESYNRQYGASHGIDYRCIMPTNLYGPGDNFHPEHSHVIPALIYRIHEAKLHLRNHVSIWGSGKPKREFLFVDDMAKACIHIMNLDQELCRKDADGAYDHINVGTGEEITIAELASIIKSIVGYRGKINFDICKPDGTPRKLLDCRKIHSFGWKPQMQLQEGLELTYDHYVKTLTNDTQYE